MAVTSPATLITTDFIKTTNKIYAKVAAADVLHLALIEPLAWKHLSSAGFMKVGDLWLWLLSDH
jgi:hypothetical protein